jgi:hypothetical protein
MTHHDQADLRNPSLAAPETAAALKERLETSGCAPETILDAIRGTAADRAKWRVLATCHAARARVAVVPLAVSPSWREASVAETVGKWSREVRLACAALIQVDLAGCGGPGGMGGCNGRSARQPWATGLGAGRWNAADGEAYREAGQRAIRLLLHETVWRAASGLYAAELTVAELTPTPDGVRALPRFGAPKGRQPVHVAMHWIETHDRQGYYALALRGLAFPGPDAGAWAEALALALAQWAEEAAEEAAERAEEAAALAIRSARTLLANHERSWVRPLSSPPPTPQEEAAQTAREVEETEHARRDLLAALDPLGANVGDVRDALAEVADHLGELHSHDKPGEVVERV